MTNLIRICPDFGFRHSSFKSEPPAGAAPARLAYKESLQAAARRRKWWAATVLPRVLRFKRPLHHSLMLAAQIMVAASGAAPDAAGL